jgi:hypothetical protein
MREYEMPMICSPRATAFFRYGAPFAQAGAPDISIEANLESLVPALRPFPRCKAELMAKHRLNPSPVPPVRSYASGRVSPAATIAIETSRKANVADLWRIFGGPGQIQLHGTEACHPTCGPPLGYNQQHLLLG